MTVSCVYHYPRVLSRCHVVHTLVSTRTGYRMQTRLVTDGGNGKYCTLYILYIYYVNRKPK